MCTTTESLGKNEIRMSRTDPGPNTKPDESSESQWDELKRARNRINSQRTRERERLQIETLETEKSRLWLSNDAIKYQNRHLRQAIAQIRELQADPSLRQSMQHRGTTAAEQGSQLQQQLSSLRGGSRQQQLLEAGASGTIASVGATPQNLAGLMIGSSEGNAASGLLGAHPSLGLQPMMRRTLGGVLPSSVNHSLILNSAPLPASALFQNDRSHQLAPLPETDLSLFGNQMANMSNMAGPSRDAISGGAFNALVGASSEDPYSERNHLGGLAGGLENIRKLQHQQRNRF